MTRNNYGPDNDFAIRFQKLEAAVGALSTRNVLQNASIGAGGITVSGGGSIRVVGGGSITLDTGTFVAGTLHATSALQVDGNGTINGALSVGAGISVSSGAVYMPTSTVVSPYARANQVTTSYVAAYINSDGSILSTASSARRKRDVADHGWTREQRDAIRVVTYRLRAAWILADMQGLNTDDVETLVGVIGEELIQAGFPELVVLDGRGRVFTVHYELMALIAIDGLQQAEAEADQARAELAETKKELGDLSGEVAELRARIGAAGIA